MAGKDFEKWYREKENINENVARVFFAEREIWHCALGSNIGFEQNGKGDAFLRLIVIFKKFNPEIFWGIPLTRTQKSGEYYFNFADGSRSVAILSQIRLLDAKRLKRKMKIMDLERFTLLKKAFFDMASS